jgi:hypothetical protein
MREVALQRVVAVTVDGSKSIPSSVPFAGRAACTFDTVHTLASAVLDAAFAVAPRAAICDDKPESHDRGEGTLSTWPVLEGFRRGFRSNSVLYIKTVSAHASEGMSLYSSY